MSRLPATRVPVRDAAAWLGLLALLLALFAPLVFSGRVIYARDIHLYWTAQAETLVRTVARGSLPLWNPHIAFGQPLLGDPNNQILYPLTWLHLLLPPWRTYTLFVLAHFALSAAGAFLSARRLGLTQAGAFVSAALWMLSGPLVSLADVWNHLAGTAWLPWALYFADRAFGERQPRDAFLWAATLAMPVFGGSAESAVMAAVLSCVPAALRFEWRAPASTANRRLVLTAAGGFLLALVLSAGQWLPTLDMVGRSARRELGEEVRTHWSVPPAGLLQIALPVVTRDLPLRAGPLHDDLQYPLLYSLYVGLPTLGLLPLAFVGPQRRLARILGALASTLVLLATGRHAVFYPVAVALMPVLRIFRYPVKATILAALCAALLAGVGFDAWRSSGLGRLLRWFLAWLALLAGLAGFAFWIAYARADEWGPLVLKTGGPPLSEVLAPTARAFGRAALVGAALVVLALLRDRIAGARAASAAGVAALAIGELVAAHRGLNRTGPPELFMYRPPTVDLVQSREGQRFYFRERRTPRGEGDATDKADARVPSGLPVPVAVAMTLRMYLTVPVGGTWGLYSSFEPNINGVQPEAVAALTALLRATEGSPAHLRLLQLGAVRRVVALDTSGLEDLRPVTTLTSLFGDPVYVLDVPDALPRAYAVGRARALTPSELPAALAAPDFDPHREVILEGGPDAAGGREAPAPAGSVSIRELKPDAVRLDADLPAPGYVVFVEAFDPGWHATVDGAVAEVRRANGAFQAVSVPAGRHEVVFTFRPRSATIGLALSAIGWLGGLVIAARRPAPAASSPAPR